MRLVLSWKVLNKVSSLNGARSICALGGDTSRCCASRRRWNKSAKALAQIVDSIEEDAERRKSSGYDVNDGQPLEARDAPDFDQLPTTNGLEGA